LVKRKKGNEANYKQCKYAQAGSETLKGGGKQCILLTKKESEYTGFSAISPTFLASFSAFSLSFSSFFLRSTDSFFLLSAFSPGIQSFLGDMLREY